MTLDEYVNTLLNLWSIVDERNPEEVAVYWAIRKAMEANMRKEMLKCAK